eukprot:6950361-Pyramimonas_sp.AAC.1
MPSFMKRARGEPDWSLFQRLDCMTVAIETRLLNVVHLAKDCAPVLAEQLQGFDRFTRDGPAISSRPELASEVFSAVVLISYSRWSRR